MWKRRGMPLALALCMLLCLCACTDTREPEPGDASAGTAQSSVVETPPEPEPFLIQYPGFVDQYFDWEDHVLILPNSAENQVDFLFELTDRKGTVLFQSDPVKPGEESGWDVSEHWKQNEHELTITATPVNADGSLGNPVSQTITVTVEMEE